MAKWMDAPEVGTWREANVLPDSRLISNLPQNYIPSLPESMKEELASRSMLDKLMAGPGAAIDRSAYGTKQLFTNLTPEEKQRQQMGSEVLKTGPGAVGGAALDTAMLTAPAGAIAGASTKLPGLFGYLGNTAGQGALGAGYGALTSPDNRGLGALAGGAGGLFGGAVAPVLGGVARPIPGSGAAQLSAEGVPTTPGMNLGGTTRMIEDAMRTGSSSVAKRQAEAIQKWSQNSVNKTLPPGANPVTGTGRNAIKEGASAYDAAYDDVFGRIGKVQYDDSLGMQLSSIESKFGPKILKSDRESLADELNRVKGEFQDGNLDGRALMDLRRSYQKLATDAMKDGKGRLGEAYTEAANALTNVVRRQAPDAARDLSAIDSNYSRFLRVQAAAGMKGAEDGVFTPAQLKTQVHAMDQSANKRAYARGNAVGQDMSEGPAGALMDTIPPVGPGTAQRLIIPLASQNVATVAPYALSNLAYSKPLQAMLTGRLPFQGMIAQPTAQGALTGATEATARAKRKNQ